MAAPSAQAPSTFATLLRRSKFSSWDSQINQVYTSPPAAAHRGNWGLKRPLLLRVAARKRKNSFLTIRQVDTNEHETEFNRAESQVRFIRRWEEIGVPPKLEKPNNPGPGIWKPFSDSASISNYKESEFCRPEPLKKEKKQEEAIIELAKGLDSHDKLDETAQEDDEEAVDLLLPNLKAMNHRSFERFLSSMHDLHPAFKQYLEGLDEKKLPINKDQLNSGLAHLADGDTKYHRQFLARHFLKSHKSKTDSIVLPQPHLNGGLMYALPSPLQRRLTRGKPERALILHNSETSKQKGRFANLHQGNNVVVSFAGMTTTLPKTKGKEPLIDLESEDGVSTNYDDDMAAQSETTVRVASAKLYQVPRTVGPKPSGLRDTRLRISLVTEDTIRREEKDQDNPFVPGSRDYVAMSDDVAAHDNPISNPPVVPRRTVPPGIRNIPTNYYAGRVKVGLEQELRKGTLDVLSVILKPGW